jgi:hypothetical protein
MTATRSSAILPIGGDPARVFSASVQSTALRRLSAVARPPVAPGSTAVAFTRTPCEAMVVRKPR